MFDSKAKIKHFFIFEFFFNGAQSRTIVAFYVSSVQEKEKYVDFDQLGTIPNWRKSHIHTHQLWQYFYIFDLCASLGPTAFKRAASAQNTALRPLRYSASGGC